MSIPRSLCNCVEPFTHNISRYRPTEYDTYRDPVGPISAGAQVLFGAIANFVTGLADVPTEVVADLVSAGRALGNPQPRSDPLRQWHKRKSQHQDLESEGEEEGDDTSGRPRGEMQRELPGVRGDNRGGEEGDEDGMLDNESEDPSESGDASESEMQLSDDQETHLDSLSSQSDVDRRRSLQLEKSETMSADIAPSKPHGAFGEIVHYGGRMSKKFVNLVIWLPTDLSLSLSKGFHNAPKLYHDPMVQTTPKVIGVRSGFRAAGKVFWHAFLVLPTF